MFRSVFAFGSVIQGIDVAMMLVVVVGAGEVLFRERLPGQLSVARIWNRRALTSKRVFLAFVLGYTLVAFFMGYQVAFYLIADKFGAWAPAEVPYDDMLSYARSARNPSVSSERSRKSCPIRWLVCSTCASWSESTCLES